MLALGITEPNVEAPTARMGKKPGAGSSLGWIFAASGVFIAVFVLVVGAFVALNGK